MDEAKHGCYAVVAKATRSIFFVGSFENCMKECGQLNVFLDHEKYEVVPHKTNDYVSQLISRQSGGGKQKTIRINLPQLPKFDPPPKLIPEPTVKERVQDYLKKIN